MKTDEARTQEQCRLAAAAGTKALEWIRDHENEQVVKPQREQLSREFRRHIVECRKLEQSADRPMAIGIFGASQAGKSYLVDRLVSKGEQTSGILFNGLPEPLDFIEHVNPGGGTESTAIATRFTVRRDATPDGFPVTVRLFSVADLVQIVGDIYYTGFEITDEPGLSSEEIEGALQLAARRKGTRPIMSAEDLWSIRDFFEKYRDKANMKSLAAHAFWERAEPILEAVDAEGIVSLFAPVWASVESLSGLFRRFIVALSSIGFADQAFCPLETLVDATGGHMVRHPESIINVSLLDNLLSAETDVPIAVMGHNGSRANVARALLGALVSELKLSVRQDTWDYLRETDLIDFPGLRPPEVVKEFRAKLVDAVLFGRVFKDSKVRFLFERYKNERELNGLVFCVAESVQDVPALPALIEDWIGTTHGASPEERVGSRVSFFIVLTKFDRELEGKRGDNESPSDRWQARLKSSLLDRLAAQSTWLEDWTPGKSFNNIYWFRNTSIRNPGIMEYESSTSSREIRINEKETDRFQMYRDGYLKSANVMKYIADPERAWEEVFKVNDGGLSYIVESLAPICDRQLKYEQIDGRLSERKRAMRQRLEPFYVATDASSRLTRAREIGRRVAQGFAQSAAAGRVGRLMTALQVLDGDLADRFAEAARRAIVTRREFSATDILGQAGMMIDIDGDGVHGTLADELANTALEVWVGAMRAAVEDGRFRSYLRISETEHGMLVDELVAASARSDLKRRIADDLREAVDRAAPGHSGLAQAALIAADSINAFVYRLGYDDVDLAARPRRTVAGNSAPIFSPLAAGGIESLREEPSSRALQYYADWIVGFGDMAIRNAQQIEGTNLNVVQNERLRDILDKLAS